MYETNRGKWFDSKRKRQTDSQACGEQKVNTLCRKIFFFFFLFFFFFFFFLKARKAVIRQSRDLSAR